MVQALAGSITESYEVSCPSSNWLVFRTYIFAHRLLERRWGDVTCSAFSEFICVLFPAPVLNCWPIRRGRKLSPG